VAGLPVALSFITLIFLGLILLPFIDRGKTRSIRKRVVYVTLGAIFVAEVVVLVIWGFLTPGQVIPNEQAALVLGGTALLISLGSVVAYKLVFGGLGLAAKRGLSSASAVARVSKSKSIAPRSTAMWTAGAFVTLLVAGAFFIGSTINDLVAIGLNGTSSVGLSSLMTSLGGLSLTVLGTLFLLYRFDLATGSIKRRVRAFEVGWKE
jgi:quinol-cytochrome oxidoreductase complex cytochrome b subunit